MVLKIRNHCQNFVTKETTAVAPTVEIPYSNKATKEVMYTVEKKTHSTSIQR